MHPFGGTPICPRCETAVYAAEQIMGPGRKLYHKPCLACKSCNKRLDSLSLVDHNQEPYCKQCHTKHFGTRDLRQANLPDRNDFLTSPSSPKSSTAFAFSPTSPYGAKTISTPPVGRTESNRVSLDESVEEARAQRTISPPPLLRPNRSFSPTIDAPRRDAVTIDSPSIPEWEPEDHPEPAQKATYNDSEDTRDGGGVAETDERTQNSTPPSTPSYAIRTYSTPISRPPSSFDSPANASFTGTPLHPSATGTRYGAALNGSPTKPLTPTKTGSWSPRTMPGTGTPVCGRCAKPVYFAEQVKASGKTFHKSCLRCTECNTSLDSKRLTDKDGQIMCHSCYGKLSI